jgi:ABC-type protease/lipase transport system fused ATPase/permease subunit
VDRVVEVRGDIQMKLTPASCCRPQNSFIITLITNIINVVSTFPGLYMVEKWGRRPLLPGKVETTLIMLVIRVMMKEFWIPEFWKKVVP